MDVALIVKIVPGGMSAPTTSSPPWVVRDIMAAAWPDTDQRTSRDREDVGVAVPRASILKPNCWICPCRTFAAGGVIMILNGVVGGVVCVAARSISDISGGVVGSGTGNGVGVGSGSGVGSGGSGVGSGVGGGVGGGVGIGVGDGVGEGVGVGVGVGEGVGVGWVAACTTACAVPYMPVSRDVAEIVKTVPWGTFNPTERMP